jgi:hypothetical protein
LQNGPPAEQLKTFPQSAPLIDLAPLIENFADTAAVIAGLDLLVTTDRRSRTFPARSGNRYCCC